MQKVPYVVQVETYQNSLRDAAKPCRNVQEWIGMDARIVYCGSSSATEKFEISNNLGSRAIVEGHAEHELRERFVH